MNFRGWRIAGLASVFVGGSIFGLNVRKALESYSVDAAMPIDSNRPGSIMKFGFPLSHSSIRIRKNYIMSYDNRLRNATWVFEHLNKDLLSEKNSERENSTFTEDRSIHKSFRARNSDYYKSGYDRGHIAAAANHRLHQEWMDETFYLSNILPQNPLLNQHAWNKLEKYVRSLVRHCDNVYVCTGPLYLPKKDKSGKLYVSYRVIGPNHIAVPTHFFKVVVCERDSQLEVLSYVMPNVPIDPNKPIDEFLCPIETIERSAGTILFDKISRNAIRKINHEYRTTKSIS